MIGDEGFFRAIEIERRREQKKLRKINGRMFNLTQRNFTAILSKNKFNFRIPKQRLIKLRRSRL